ncbi:MAG: hypothetical protein A3B68_03130 [Candidatus Melainabacteria bacterium RIFCSPHIGHO2_02_FULL_34_12]|nr:MAG: hypothetical protein A3B68_03130 [Candidatus Melainabacteria bacterium RIFCSPHIGHO2_02_FULL_34_12]
MFERHYPPKDQIAGLSKLLTFLSNDKIYWHEIWINGDTIVVKTEPPKGENDLRIFYIYEDGELDNDGFRD